MLVVDIRIWTLSMLRTISAQMSWNGSTVGTEDRTSSRQRMVLIFLWLGGRLLDHVDITPKVPPYTPQLS